MIRNSLISSIYLKTLKCSSTIQWIYTSYIYEVERGKQVEIPKNKELQTNSTIPMTEWRNKNSIRRCRFQFIAKPIIIRSMRFLLSLFFIILIGVYIGSIAVHIWYILYPIHIDYPFLSRNFSVYPFTGNFYYYLLIIWFVQFSFRFSTEFHRNKTENKECGSECDRSDSATRFADSFKILLLLLSEFSK